MDSLKPFKTVIGEKELHLINVSPRPVNLVLPNKYQVACPPSGLKLPTDFRVVQHERDGLSVVTQGFKPRPEVVAEIAKIHAMFPNVVLLGDRPEADAYREYNVVMPLRETNRSKAVSSRSRNNPPAASTVFLAYESRCGHCAR